MDKYLLHILKDTNTIIIPGLGALTITNVNTGEIMFMPYLKHDDGTLSQYIADKEGWEINDAKNLIAKYVRDIQAKLEKGEDYSMYQFGTFRKVDGDVEFINWSEEKTTDKNSEENPIIDEKAVKEETEFNLNKEEILDSRSEPNEGDSIETQEATIEMLEKVEQIEEKNESEIEPLITSGNVSEENFVNDELERIEVAKEENHNQEAEIIAVQEDEKSEELESLVVDEITISEPGTSSQTDKIYYQEVVIEEKKSRGIGFWLLLLLILLLIGGGTYTYFNYDNVKSWFGNKEVLAKSDPVTTEPEENDDYEAELSNDDENAPMVDTSLQTESESTEITESEELDVKTTEIIPQVESVNKPSEGTPYHVIGGAFSVKSNADRYAQKLANDGNPSVIVGRFDSLYLVSIKSFPSAEEAKSNLGNLQSVSQNAWLFKWP